MLFEQTRDKLFLEINFCIFNGIIFLRIKKIF